MRTQPIEHTSMRPTQVLPMMPTVGKVTKTPQPKLQPTRKEAVDAAKARISRRKSLRKQREALKQAAGSPETTSARPTGTA
jgi:hypothetical protein